MQYSRRTGFAGRFSPIAVLLALFLAGSFFASPALADQKSLLKNSPKIKAAFRKVVEQVRLGVVEIVCQTKSDKKPIQVAMGSVVGADGWILTKASELRGEIVCKFRHKGQHVAKLVGVNEEYDLAMLKIDADDLPTIQWNEATGYAAGQWVVTAGVDKDPLAVGVVSVSRREIPRQRPWLGVSLGQGINAPRIDSVNPDSAAEEAGLKKGDLVTHVNGKRVKTVKALIDTIRGFQPGVELKISIKRHGKESKVAELMVTAILKKWRRSPTPARLNGPTSRVTSGFPTAFQHDTALRPDQCGGPLVGLDGKVMGINIARAGRVVSYAIPADVVVKLLAELKSGKLAPPDVLVSTTAGPSNPSLEK